jgi:3D-(3,5/4)-trihydroxycyclohexane-1,2-dione acylhydrolase (decyclizing)
MATPKKKTIRLTVGQAIVKYLQVQYSDRDGKTRRFIPALFGIFGHGNVVGLGQALEEYGRDLPYHQCRNEQSMVHTASGFAKANLRLATLACTSSIGPGATNMVTGAATATINRLPVLLLPGDYYATRYQGPVLQQLEHPVSADISVNDCFRPVSRFFDRILRPEHLLTALPEAMRVLTHQADTGAVTLALPQDLQSFAYDYPAHFFEKRIWSMERRLPHPQRIADAVKMLKIAKRPMIIAGGGVIYSDAGRELAAFSKRHGIPVSETSAGKGAIQDPSPLLLGGHGTNGTYPAGKCASDADLIISIGTRLADFNTASQSAFQNPDVRFIAVNVCDHDAFKQQALPIVADARLTLQALSKAAGAAGVKPRATYVRQIEKLTTTWKQQIRIKVFSMRAGRVMSQGQAIGIVNEQAKQGDTIVAAAGFPPGDLLKLWDATAGRRAHLEFGNSCMGYELPAGLGVRMSQPRGEVYVFIGDGTFLMSPSELVTAMQEELKVTVIIMQNHGFQSIHELQRWRTGKSFANEFRKRNSKTRRLDGNYLPIDLTKVGEGMGTRSWYVKTPDEMRQAMRQARQEKRSCMIVAEIDSSVRPPDSGLWWDFEVAETSGDAGVKKLRKSYEKEQKSRRFHH